MDSMKVLVGIFLTISQLYGIVHCDGGQTVTGSPVGTCAKDSGQANTSNEFRRVCYYAPLHHITPNYTALNLSLCTHVIYGFARISDNDTIEAKNQTIDPPRYKNLTNHVNSTRSQVKTLLCLSEGNFSRMVATEDTREKFLNSTMEKLKEWGFGGLDVDWEFPGYSDRENFITFLREAKERLKNESMLLTVALPVYWRYINESYNDTVMVSNLSQVIDFANIMAYDLSVYSWKWRRFTGPNSPLFSWSDYLDNGKRYIEWAVNYWVQNLTLPKDKIVVGIPFYGRYYNLTDPGSNHSMFANATNTTVGWGDKVTYPWVCRFLKNTTTAAIFHNRSRTPYAYNNDSSAWVSYDDKRSVCEKVNWILSGSYGGVMSYAFDYDDIYGTNCTSDSTVEPFPLQSMIYKLTAGKQICSSDGNFTTWSSTCQNLSSYNETDTK